MTFITIKLSATEELIVNPDCLCIAMLHYIRESCGLIVSEQLDIATMDGEVLDLQSHLKENGKSFFEDRNSYYIVKVIGDENEESIVNYLPIYDGPEIEKLKFTLASTAVVNATNRPKPGSKLNPISSQQARSSSLLPSNEKSTAPQDAHANSKESHDESAAGKKKQGQTSSNGRQTTKKKP